MTSNTIRSTLFEIQLGITDARDSMHNKEHPHYGNGIRAMQILETKGTRLLEQIPVFEAWMREYEAGRAWLWIQSLLEEGTQRVEKYKHWSAWSSVPPMPCMGSMEAWALVEKAYEGALDVRFSVALQGAYRAACRFSEKPFRHEGECWGGLVCMACEGDEWTWIQQCLDEVALPNNVFWDSQLHGAFLAEVKGEAKAMKDLEVPAEWTFVPEKAYFSDEVVEGTTPFQCVAKLTSRAYWNWLGILRVRDTTPDFEMYKMLARYMPGLVERIRKDLSMCDGIREMY